MAPLYCTSSHHSCRYQGKNIQSDDGDAFVPRVRERMVGFRTPDGQGLMCEIALLGLSPCSCQVPFVSYFLWVLCLCAKLLTLQYICASFLIAQPRYGVNSEAGSVFLWFFCQRMTYEEWKVGGVFMALLVLRWLIR